MNNPDLIEQIAGVTAHELTISGHDWTFAPTLAVPRDLRWGRSYEGFSEDPDIVQSYGGRIVIGLQGKFGSDDFMSDGKVISSAKHFLADGATGIWDWVTGKVNGAWEVITDWFGFGSEEES